MISLEDFLTTNRAPNDEEKREIRQFISEYDDTLTTITTKIRDLETQLQALNDEKAALLEVVAPFKHALLPFRQLPDDVVREIFMACLPAGRNPTMSNKEAPVLLTQISRATRRIALETPALWLAIHIAILPPSSLRFMDYSPTLKSARAEAVEEWLLRRSGSLPLNISVYHPEHPHEHRDFGQDIIDVMLSCSSRWRRVSFSDMPNHLLRISTLNHTDVPVLNSLSILSNRVHHHKTDWNSSLILTAPSLQMLSVSGKPKPTDFLANWSNLTHISFPRTFHSSPLVFAADMATILRQTTRLISCRFNIPIDRGELREPIDEISLPFLKVLIVNDHTNLDVVGGILSSIHAPALEAMQYNLSDEMNTIPKNLKSLLKRTPNLQELWTGKFAKPALLVECLRHCPSLTSLRVSSLCPGYDDRAFTMNNAFIEAFVPDNITQSCLCPRLEYFQCDSTVNLSLGTLHRFIKHVKNGPNQSLGRQNTVVMRVAYHPEDEHQHYIDEFTSKDVIGDMRLSLLLEKEAAASNPIFAGVKTLETPENEWWQSRSMSTLDI